MRTLYLLLIICYSSFAQDVWVNGYYKSDGTYVDGYYKTNPNLTVNDNYSTIGNRNPYTGEWGDKPRETSSSLLNIRPEIPAGNVVTRTPLPNIPYVPNYNYTEADRTEDYLRKHLKSPLNINSQPQMSFSDKANTLNDKSYNFEEYNVKPQEVYKENSSGELEPIDNNYIVSQNESERDNESLKIVGVIFGLFCVFATFIILLFTKRTKRF